ncbi:glutathione S-transferase [Arenicella sp. 4NH20-0111]|uniref:glutathione S-transferase family protein n=1 Tax=Arenicella sp. 4NH20-0111 TaxID=3127648 RepID=UPI003109EF0B
MVSGYSFAFLNNSTPNKAMELYYQTHSPYARKVLVLIHELGLTSQTKVTHYETSPTLKNKTVFNKNPLGKVPILLDKGLTMFDSSVICRYLLDSYNNNSKVTATTISYQMEALATGIADAGILARWEIHRRPEAKRHQPFLDGQLLKLSEAYDYLERQAVALGGKKLDFGEIALACSLAWVNYVQLPCFATSRPKLKRWYEEHKQRQSMALTAYSGTTTDLVKHNN